MPGWPVCPGSKRPPASNAIYGKHTKLRQNKRAKFIQISNVVQLGFQQKPKNTNGIGFLSVFKDTQNASTSLGVFMKSNVTTLTSQVGRGNGRRQANAHHEPGWKIQEKRKPKFPSLETIILNEVTIGSSFLPLENSPSSLSMSICLFCMVTASFGLAAICQEPDARPFSVQDDNFSRDIIVNRTKDCDSDRWDIYETIKIYHSNMGTAARVTQDLPPATFHGLSGSSTRR